MAIVVAEPPALAVPLAEVKAFLRIGTSEEDALIAGLVRSAAETCEAFTGRALIARPVEETLRAARAWIRLGATPVRSIEQVARLDPDGLPEPLPAVDYAIDIDAAGDGWVRLPGAGGVLPTGRAGRIRVSYRTGMAAGANGIPEALRHGIVRLAAHLYTHRDSADAPGPPAAVTALWRPWRRLRLR